MKQMPKTIEESIQETTRIPIHIKKYMDETGQFYRPMNRRERREQQRKNKSKSK